MFTDPLFMIGIAGMTVCLITWIRHSISNETTEPFLIKYLSSISFISGIAVLISIFINSGDLGIVLLAGLIISLIHLNSGSDRNVSPEEANILTSTRNASPSHVLLDPTGTVGQMFEAKTTPHMYILDEKGLMKYQGAIDDAGGRGFMFKDLMQSNNYVKEGLKELKDGKSVTIPITKPYGCSVKYAS